MKKSSVTRIRAVLILIALIGLQGVLNEQDQRALQCETDTQCENNDYR